MTPSGGRSRLPAPMIYDAPAPGQVETSDNAPAPERIAVPARHGSRHHCLQRLYRVGTRQPGRDEGGGSSRWRPDLTMLLMASRSGCQ